MSAFLWNSMTLNTFDAKEVVRVYREVKSKAGVVTLGGDLSEETLLRLENLENKLLVLSYDQFLNQLNIRSLKNPIYENTQCVTYLVPEQVFINCFTKGIKPWDK